MNDIRIIDKLPLNGTQLGIWLADQVADEVSSNGYVISHCVHVRGPLDAALLGRAIRIGLAGADTVMARYRADGVLVPVSAPAAPTAPVAARPTARSTPRPDRLVITGGSFCVWPYKISRKNTAM